MKDRSLKDEMREALRGDRERAEARRKAEAEGTLVGPAPPTLDLNKPTREWKLPQKAEEPQPAEEPEPGEEPDPTLEQEPEAAAEDEIAEPEAPEPEPAAEAEPEPEPAAELEPEPPSEPRGLLARLRAFFGG